jgi:hypothetical protein
MQHFSECQHVIWNIMALNWRKKEYSSISLFVSEKESKVKLSPGTGLGGL